MNALLFRLRRTIRNTLLDMLHHPARLAAYLFVVAMLLFSGLSLVFSPREAGRGILTCAC